jgi:hypothetical protein
MIVIANGFRVAFTGLAIARYRERVRPGLGDSAGGPRAGAADDSRADNAGAATLGQRDTGYV